MGKSKKIILIVEDEFFLAETIRTRLEFSGYEVCTAENGKAALEFLENNPADLILMDIMMPVMDGFEATKNIKGQERLKKIPVIFLTSRARHEDHLKAAAVGGDDYIAKPFESRDLLRAIEKWCPR